MDKIKAIDEAIINAEQGKSKLIQEAVDNIGGYTSPKVRHLLNNIGAISKHYIEIGCHRGSTFVAANYGNEHLCSFAVDNFSEFNEDGSVEKEFNENCKNYLANNNYIFANDDCFKLKLPNKLQFDFYLYDGNHSYESQKKAITHFYDALADECIVCIDDSDWYDVQKGTQHGILACKFKMLHHRYLTGADGWHNGIDIYLLKK